MTAASSDVAIVMNMFYTGLGIARSLGEQGVTVLGLSSRRDAYGNYTRYARVSMAPDSREEPEALLAYMLNLADSLPGRAVVFPTRDDDLRFLERYRHELSARFILAIPDTSALKTALDKWNTYLAATAAGVPVPSCWTVAHKDDLVRLAPELHYPCVIKPISAHQWRQGDNWRIVGHRKAIPVDTPEQLYAEYDRIAEADPRVLVQEMVPGSDDRLHIAACYLDANSNCLAGFTVQKLLQVPEGCGTGCLVQTTDRPELVEMAAALLQSIGFSGIAEVEFKQDPTSGEYKLIEINPRPWDQHRLGKACGVDLVHVAFRNLLGHPAAEVRHDSAPGVWIAEDVLAVLLLRTLWRRQSVSRYLRLIRGHRVYAILSWRDPLPILMAFAGSMFPGLAGSVAHKVGSIFGANRFQRLLNKRSAV